MKKRQTEEQGRRAARLPAQVVIFLRAAVPLLLAVLALLAGPALLLWWLRGGAFDLSDALIGGAISLALLLALGLAFGWAVGRLTRKPRK